MTTPQPDTEQLLRRAGNGDPDARDGLLASHRDRLRTMIAWRLDRRLAAHVDPSEPRQRRTDREATGSAAVALAELPSDEGEAAVRAASSSAALRGTLWGSQDVVWLAEATVASNALLEGEGARAGPALAAAWLFLAGAYRGDTRRNGGDAPGSPFPRVTATATENSCCRAPDVAMLAVSCLGASEGRARQCRAVLSIDLKPPPPPRRSVCAPEVMAISLKEDRTALMDRAAGEQEMSCNLFHCCAKKLLARSGLAWAPLRDEEMFAAAVTLSGREQEQGQRGFHRLVSIFAGSHRQGPLMAEEDSFRGLMRRVRAGDDGAAAEVVRRFEPAIRRVVRLRLRDQQLRRLFDSMDVCQSVLGNFFVRAAAGEFELSTAEQLRKLLSTMARNNLTNRALKQRTAGRDQRRVEAGGPEERELAARGSTPSQQLATRELLQEARRRLSDEERRLLERREEGREWSDIAQELGGRPEALRKQLARAVARVAQELGLDEVGNE
jgi:RNA polymerase sigma-70 factor (ECF subfamily)